MICALLVFIMLCTPLTALSAEGFNVPDYKAHGFNIPGFSVPRLGAPGFDAYGFNDRLNLFVGTFENWEAFIYGEPPLPQADPRALDVMFVVRKWDKAWDEAMMHNGTPKNGMWCTSYFWTNLSGDQLGWKWQEFFHYRLFLQTHQRRCGCSGYAEFLLYRR